MEIKLGIVLMMDESSVMERVYITVVPLTAVLRIYLLPNVPCPPRIPRVDFQCVSEVMVLNAHFTHIKKH